MGNTAFGKVIKYSAASKSQKDLEKDKKKTKENEEVSTEVVDFIKVGVPVDCYARQGEVVERGFDVRASGRFCNISAPKLNKIKACIIQARVRADCVRCCCSVRV